MKNMTSTNWIELAILLLVNAAGLTVSLLCGRKLKRYNGFEGIITERGELPKRQVMALEDEIKHLEGLLEKE